MFGPLDWENQHAAGRDDKKLRFYVCLLPSSPLDLTRHAWQIGVFTRLDAALDIAREWINVPAEYQAAVMITKELDGSFHTSAFWATPLTGWVEQNHRVVWAASSLMYAIRYIEGYEKSNLMHGAAYACNVDGSFANTPVVTEVTTPRKHWPYRRDTRDQ